jgi:hypothetical protein
LVKFYFARQVFANWKDLARGGKRSSSEKEFFRAEIKKSVISSSLILARFKKTQR